MSKLKFVVTLLASAAITVSCSSHHPTGPGDDDSGGDDAGGGGGGGDGGVDSGFGSCAATFVQATLKPLDIYIMLDQSGSMADDNKWTDVGSAINAFVSAPGNTGISVGLQYFANTDSNNNDECDVTNYATPSIAIAALPGAASSISGSIAGHSPTSDTPTLPAEEGATQYASSWATANPDDKVIVVLATDGEPNGCSSTVTKVANAAGSAFAATPSIPTYVIGVGTSTGNLNTIAAGGGTGSAFIVDTGSNAGSAFLAALNAIRGASLGCTYAIPQPMNGQTLDYNEVNVIYTPGGSTTQEVIPQVTDASACPASGDAWYYDNASAPTEIILCTNTCNTIQADTSGAVNIGLGCQTIIP